MKEVPAQLCSLIWLYLLPSQRLCLHLSCLWFCSDIFVQPGSRLSIQMLQLCLSPVQQNCLPTGPGGLGVGFVTSSQPFITDTKVLASVEFHIATLLHIAPKHHFGPMQQIGAFQSRKIDFLQVRQRSVNTSLYIIMVTLQVFVVCHLSLYSQLQYILVCTFLLNMYHVRI